MGSPETWPRKSTVFSIEKLLRVGVVGLGLMASCSSSPPPGSVVPGGARPSLPQPTWSGQASPAGQAPARVAAPTLPLAAPGPVHNWAEVRLQAAHRLMAANPD